LQIHTQASDVAEPKADKTTSKAEELLVRVRKHYKIAEEADRDNREEALKDLKFLHKPGEQWDEWTRQKRGAERPMYEFNKTRITVKRVVNDMRANRPQGKVRAVEDGDKPTSNVMEGLIRNIWNTADGDTVIDTAAEYQVGAGMGAWRVTVDYADDEAFEQKIGVDPIRNPFCLFADPSAQDSLKRDAKYWILTDKVSKETYESRWPNKEVCSFEADQFDDDHDWQSEEKVRICEYWWKEPVAKTLCLLGNGMTIDKSDPNATPELIEQAGGVVKERPVKSHKIMMCIVGGGDAILDGPVEWVGKEFPFVMIYGEYVVIEGKTYWFGLTRFAKDAQRSYNVSRTNAIESVALTPQAKFWATAEQALGHTAAWAEANTKNFPFMLYNADAKTGGAPPQRMGSADVPVALIQEMQISSEDIKAVTGIYDASLGAQGNETSGKAINARQRQGEIATFNYMDNMAKGIRRTWEILIDLVPRIYDTERSVRILGIDGAEDYAKVNTVDPKTGKALNDLSRGKYDVTVTVGPSFATLRQEAAEAYGEIASRDPNVMAAAGDLIFKAMDLPYSEQIAERIKAMLPPPIQQLISKGKELPPEVASAMAQVNQAMQMVDEKGKLVTAAEQELKELQAQAKGDAASAKLAQANLKTAEVQLEQRFNELQSAQDKLTTEKALFDAHVENAMLKIKLAKAEATHAVTESIHHHENTQRDVADAVTDGANQLEAQKRDVQDTVKDGSHQLEKQATQMSVQNMQAQHKQQMSQANKPKPKK
jgi:hypothetical protein